LQALTRRQKGGWLAGTIDGLVKRLRRSKPAGTAEAPHHSGKPAIGATP
jgi:hypothetical protein